MAEGKLSWYLWEINSVAVFLLVEGLRLHFLLFFFFFPKGQQDTIAQLTSKVQELEQQNLQQLQQVWPAEGMGLRGLLG